MLSTSTYIGFSDYQLFLYIIWNDFLDSINK